jgi:MFS family permease
MVMNAVGLLIGPPALGAVADHTGLTSAFIAGTLLMLLTTALAPAEELRRERGPSLSRRVDEVGPP